MVALPNVFQPIYQDYIKKNTMTLISHDSQHVNQECVENTMISPM